MKTRFAAVIACGFFAAGTQADVLSYQAFLSGLAEAPPNASPGTGFALVDFDTVAHTMRVQITFSGLLAGNTACHIHSATTVPGTGTAPVATTTPTFTGFPTGATSGSYDHTFDLALASSWNPSFITAHGGTPATAEAFFLGSVAGGTAYVNLHSSVFTGGEIRGFLQPVPAPGVAALLGAGGLLAIRRRRRERT